MADRRPIAIDRDPADQFARRLTFGADRRRTGPTSLCPARRSAGRNPQFRAQAASTRSGVWYREESRPPGTESPAAARFHRPLRRAGPPARSDRPCGHRLEPGSIPPPGPWAARRQCSPPGLRQPPAAFAPESRARCWPAAARPRACPRLPSRSREASPFFVRPPAGPL